MGTKQTSQDIEKLYFNNESNPIPASFPQDLFDPLGLNKEPVTPEVNDNAQAQLPAQEAPIVNRVGNPYRTAADAQTIMENKGLADTHEVIPYQCGYALQRKGAQALVQDLFDPLGLNKEFVTSEETTSPAKMSNNFVTSPDGKIDFGNIPAEIEEKSGGKYPEAPIRMEEGAKEDYGRSHIGEERIKEIKDAGYKDELDMLSDVAKNYTQIYEQPNGRLLLVKKNGKSKYAVVELQKNPDNYYGTTTMFFDEKPLRGKPYEERSGRKLLLDVARTPDSGQSVPFPIAGVEDRADNSRRWDKSNSLSREHNIATQGENVNTNGLTDSPQIVEGIRQSSKSGKIVPRRTIPGK